MEVLIISQVRKTMLARTDKRGYPKFLERGLRRERNLKMEEIQKENVPKAKLKLTPDNILTMCLILVALAGALYLGLEAIALGIGIIFFLFGKPLV